MITIAKSLEANSGIDHVWSILSDLDQEHKYWSTIKSVKILSTKDNSIEREATIRRGPIGDAKSVQTLVIDPEQKSSTLTMTKGPVLGTRQIALTRVSEERTKIGVRWEFELKGIPRFAQGFAKDSISDATDKALAKLAQAAEERQMRPIPETSHRAVKL